MVTLELLPAPPKAAQRSVYRSRLAPDVGWPHGGRRSLPYGGRCGSPLSPLEMGCACSRHLPQS